MAGQGLHRQTWGGAGPVVADWRTVAQLDQRVDVVSVRVTIVDVSGELVKASDREPAQRAAVVVTGHVRGASPAA